MNPLLIYPPIEIIPTTEYALVVKDSTGTYYYFNSDGLCDGHSHDCIKDEGYAGAKVKCDLCGNEWVGVFPMKLERLECPNCHNMVFYEIII